MKREPQGHNKKKPPPQGGACLERAPHCRPRARGQRFFAVPSCCCAANHFVCRHLPSERDARRAIVLAPAYAKGHQRLAKALAAQGDTAGARHASKTAKRLAKGLTAAAQSAGTTVASASAASAPSPAPLPSGGGGAAAVFPPGAPAPAAAASPPGVSPGAQLAAGSDVCALVRASCCSLFPTPAPANALVSVDDDAIEALFAPGTGVLAPAAASPTAVAAGAVGTALV